MFAKVTTGLLILLPFSLLAGTTGKIEGLVKDKETGEPLPGVNVIIVGTTMGAATNADGEYFILNIPVGVYSVTASMVGYRSVTVERVKISIDLTTRVDFALPPTVIEVGPVTVTVERPMVAKEVTSSLHVASTEEFKNLPFTNTQHVVQVTAGVDGSSIRGGLGNEVTYLVDGLSINDPMFHTASTTINLNAVEELQVTTGAYNAEYGEAMSGIVNVVTKEGGTETNLAYEITTDRLSRNLFGKKYDNGYWKNEFSLGGPVPLLGDKFKYFLAANTVVADVASPRMYSFTHYDWDHPYPKGQHREYWRPHNGQQDYGTNFKFTWLINDKMKLRLGGFYNRDQREVPLDEGQSQTPQRSYLFREDDYHVYNQKSRQIYLNLTHQLNPKTFYDLRLVNFLTRRQDGLAKADRYDPETGRAIIDEGSFWDFFDDYTFRGLTEYHPQDWANPENPFGVENLFQARDATGRAYFLHKERYWGVKFDGVHQLTLNHELKVGFEYYRHLLRRYWNSLPWDPEPFLEAYGYRLIRDSQGRHTAIEEYDGKETVPWDRYEPYKPWTGALYFQDSMEYPGFIVNAGVRLDAFYAYARKRVDPYDWYSPTTPVSVKWRVSPRLGISHPVSDRTVLYFFYGRFFQTPNFEHLFRFLDPITTRSYVGIGYPDLDAMKTNSYEVGIKHQLREDVAVELTLYYKDYFEILGSTIILAVPFNYSHYSNADFANSKGLEVTLRKRLSNYFRTEVNFSYWKRDSQVQPSFTQLSQWLIDPRTGEQYPRPYRLKGLFHYRGNWILDIVFPENFGPSLFGIQPLENAYFDFVTTLRSGDYYTRTDDKGEPVGDYWAAQLPLRTQTDLEAMKYFNVFGGKVALFAQVINLFGRKNILSVFSRTGRPDDDGKIINEANITVSVPSRWKPDGTEHPQWKWVKVKDLDGDERISQHEEYLAYKAAWKFRSQVRPDFYGDARQYRLGLRFEF